MSTPETKLDPRVIRTRKLLKEAILSLIPEKSFSDITIKEITDRATLNRVTFYLHYDDKLDLLQDASYQIWDELVQSYSQYILDSSPEASYNIILANFQHFQKHESFYKAVLERDGVLQFVRSMEDYIYHSNLKRLQGSEEEPGEISLELELFLRHLASGFVGVASWWLEKDQPLTPNEMADQLSTLYLMGYRPQFSRVATTSRS
jgi:AcrR family transcriptional regulator